MAVFDERARRAADHCGLTLGEALAGGSRSAVFAATDRRARNLVLKLPAADSDGGVPAAAEAAALSGWAASGAAVTLVDATPDALLLDRARPGMSLPWTPAASLNDRIGVAADLLARLWASPNESYGRAELAVADGRAELASGSATADG